MTKYSKEERAKLLGEWKASGQSRWAFAKAKEIKAQTFVTWTKKAVKQAPFVEIKTKPCLAGTGETVIVEKGEIKVHLPLEVFRQNNLLLSKLLGLNL